MFVYLLIYLLLILFSSFIFIFFSFCVFFHSVFLSFFFVIPLFLSFFFFHTSSSSCQPISIHFPAKCSPPNWLLTSLTPGLSVFSYLQWLFTLQTFLLPFQYSPTQRPSIPRSDVHPSSADNASFFFLVFFIPPYFSFPIFWNARTSFLLIPFRLFSFYFSSNSFFPCNFFHTRFFINLFRYLFLSFLFFHVFPIDIPSTFFFFSDVVTPFRTFKRTFSYPLFSILSPFPSATLTAFAFNDSSIITLTSHYVFRVTLFIAFIFFIRTLFFAITVVLTFVLLPQSLLAFCLHVSFLPPNLLSAILLIFIFVYCVIPSEAI